MSLQERLREEFTNSLPFMTGREKGKTEELIGKTVTLIDCGLLAGEDGDFGVAIFKEYEKEFFFGGSVLSDIIKTIVKNNDVEELRREGLTLKFSTEKSKKTKRNYTKVEIL